MDSEFLLSLLKRSRSDGFKLVCVTKSRTVDDINEVLNLGVTDIGENRVQEAKSKFADLKYPCTKHLIGHLQTNKVKDAVVLFDYIHSVDSLKLAKKIDLECSNIMKKVNIFLEVNISGELSKYGFSVDEIESVYNEISKLKNIECLGFMTIAPFSDNPENSRDYFRKLKNLAKNYSLNCLSMGMSTDYLVAIEEGATHIRVGSKIFTH